MLQELCRGAVDVDLAGPGGPTALSFVENRTILIMN